MKSLLLISLFLLVSCGQKKYMPVKQDPILQSIAYESSFAEYAPKYGVDDKIRKMSLKFGQLGYNGSGVIGQCVIYQKSHFNGIKNEVYEYGREIVIDINYYQQQIKNSTNGKENLDQLMTHELGHCSLNRNHQDGYFVSKNQGISVMNSDHGNVVNYSTGNFLYYMEELFTRRIDVTNITSSFKGYSLSQVYGMTDKGTLASTYHKEEVESYEHGHEHVDGDEHECEDGHVKIVMLGENDENE